MNRNSQILIDADGRPADGVLSAAIPDTPDRHIAPPLAEGAMFHGLIGAVARSAGEGSESNPVAIAAGMLCWLSAEAGRDVYLQVGDVVHHARINMLHVGRSGIGAKGESLAPIKRLRGALAQQWPTLLGHYFSGGLSTREGLALVLHDGYKQGKEAIPPIRDKRLLVVESEFANVLHQAAREGNTLSAALRDAWDGESIRPATKNNRVWATDPHISLAAAITPTELLDLMKRRELTNGFANRFLIFWAERVRVVAFPRGIPDATLQDLAERVAEVIRFARGSYPETANSRRARLTPAAERLWTDLVHGELTRQHPNPVLAGLMERQRPMLLRIALILALMDLTLEIDRHHIEAARAWIEYWRASVQYIFAQQTDDVQDAEQLENAERILHFLAERGEADRTQLLRDCFVGHLPADRLDAALEHLLVAIPPRICLTVLPRSDGKSGRGRKIYSLLHRVGGSGESGANTAMVQIEKQLPSGAVGEFGGVSVSNSPGSTQVDTVQDNATAPTLDARIEVEI